VADLDLEDLRRRHLSEQAEAAEAEALERFRRAAGERPLVYQRETSPWVAEVLRVARRAPCAHAPRRGSQLVIVPAFIPQWLCRGCGDRALARVAGTPDELRCDVCREVAGLAPFMVHAGTVLVSGKHCAGCRATVYGGSE
jgi:hypothetical protein